MHYESTQFSNLLMLALLSALATILYVRLGTRVLRTQPRDRLNQLFFLVCIRLHTPAQRSGVEGLALVQALIPWLDPHALSPAPLPAAAGGP
jgi:hypothetical protein